MSVNIRTNTPPAPPHSFLARVSRMILASASRAALAQAVLTFLVFLPAVNCDFVNWDDNDYVYENPRVLQGLSDDGLRYAFTGTLYHSWAPLTALSYLVDVSLFGVRPAGFHLTNVVLHAVTSGFLSVALCRMTGTVGRSAAVATLFALHPLRVESVVWIAERKDVLSVLFLVLAMLAYERYCRRPGVWRFSLVFAAMLASLLSKATAVTLPGLLLLLDVWPLGRLSVPGMAGPVRGDGTPSPYPSRSWPMAIVEKLPLAAVSLVFAFFQIVASRGGLVTVDVLPFFSRRIPNAVYAFNWYLLKTFWPTNLHPAHTHFGEGHSPWLVALCAAGVLTTVAIAAVSARRSPAVTVGLAWFATALVPVIGLVPVGIQSHSDRFAYIPHIGLFIAIVWGGMAVLSRWPDRPWLPATLLIGTLIAYVPLDRHQIAVWKDSETLWRHVLTIEPDNAFACNNLAVALHEAGRSDEAVQYLERAISQLPQQNQLRMNLEKIQRDLRGSAGDRRLVAPPTPETAP